MSTRAPKTILALAPLLALVACQDPDVGAPCQLQSAQLPPSAADLFDQGTEADFIQSGIPECDHLICIVSPAPNGSPYRFSGAGEGYCSKPCISNDDCFQDETGLVCRQMVLDPAFISSLDQATRDRYNLGIANYCGVPR